MLYILPDSAGDLLIAQASDTLTENDFQEVLLSQIEKQLKTDQALRLVLYFDHNLQKIEEETSWQSALLTTRLPCNVKGIAVVGGKQWQQWHCELKTVSQYFSESQFLQALHWIDDL